MALTRYPTVSGATYWTTLTAGASANTKGAYVELTASTAEALRGLVLTVPIGNTGAVAYRIDLAIGAASSEVVIVADVAYGLPVGASTANEIGVFIPVAIASGVRLSARCQCSAAFATVNLAVLAVGGTSTAVPTTYGISGSTSYGTVMDPGGSANTKSAYAELVAATTADLDWLIILVTSGEPNSVSGSYAIDVATGAASSEVVVVPDIGFMRVASTIDNLGPVAVSVPVTISSGTRLAARVQSTVTTATVRVCTMQVIGITNSGMNGGSSSSTGGSYTFVG